MCPNHTTRFIQAKLQFNDSPYFPPDPENYAPWVSKWGLLAPYGICQCQQCGQPAPIAVKTNSKYGYLEGEPARYVHNHHGKRSVAERFWEKVDKNGPNGCWIWLGSKNKFGHGTFSIDGRWPNAHCVSWELHYGPIPQGLGCLHKCPAEFDNPSCVNPTHLYLGTQADNIADAIAKGTISRGEHRYNSKLTRKDVIKIRQLCETDMSQRVIADMFGVGQQTISRIVNRKSWKHVK